jgi:predicted ATP-grasp superfamily ATP-dependent carboligase
LGLIDGQVYSGQIVGAVGILINIAGSKGLENMCMLVEIGESAPDYFAARRAAEALIKLTGLNIEVDGVEEFMKLSNRVISMLES